MTNKQRIFLIHGWTGHANKDWFPWGKEVLTQRGYETTVPEMPDSDNPICKVWIDKMHQLIDPPKPNDILVGHSIGCLAVLRYLETLNENQRVGKVILIAPWETLSDIAIENENDRKIFKDWTQPPVNYSLIKTKVSSFVTLFSKDDPMVPFGKNQKLFAKKLNPQMVIVDKMGHFSQEDGVTELPQLLDLI